jgi:choline dehydrogenase
MGISIPILLLILKSVANLATLLKPKSSGTLSLKSANLADQLVIKPNYFQNKEDLNTIVQGLKLARNIWKASAVKDKVKPLDQSKNWGIPYDTDEYFHELIRRYTVTVYHPVSQYNEAFF